MTGFFFRVARLAAPDARLAPHLLQNPPIVEPQLAVVGNPGTSSFYLNAQGLVDPDPAAVPNFQGWVFQCVAGAQSTYPPCEPTGSWTSAYPSAEVASPTGVEQTGYGPNTDYMCYLGVALSDTTYMCPSTVAGQARVDTAVLTPSEPSNATPSTSSIDVSNNAAVQQGTADGSTYGYVAQCVLGSGTSCDPNGAWVPATPTDDMTLPVSVAVDSSNTNIAPNTAYTYVHQPRSGMHLRRAITHYSLVGCRFPAGVSLEPSLEPRFRAMMHLLSPRRH